MVVVGPPAQFSSSMPLVTTWMPNNWKKIYEFAEKAPRQHLTVTSNQHKSKINNKNDSLSYSLNPSSSGGISAGLP
jgi:hypothetical protein